MTPRERALAAFRNSDVDRVPFTVYSGLVAPDDDVRGLLGDRITFLQWASVHRTEYRRVTFASETFAAGGEERRRDTYQTPVGNISRTYRFDPTYHSLWAVDSYIKKPQDWDVLRFIYEDIVYREGYDQFLEQRAKSPQAVLMAAMGRTPFQSLCYEWAGVERVGIDFYDCPDKVRPLLDLMLARQNELDRIYAASPAELIDFPDNITAIVIGRERFARYCLPRYRNLAQLAQGTGKILVAHMDGMLKPLADLIRDCALTGLEAFTPVPDGDVSVAEARRLWPAKRLSINFPSSVHLAAADAVYRQARIILDEASPVRGFIVGVTENVPSDCWRRSFAAIDEAITDFHRQLH